MSLLVNCSPPSLSPSPFLSLLSSQCHSLQLLWLMSFFLIGFFFFFLSVPACRFLPLCLNKCKHGEGSFKQAHTLRIFHVGHTESRRRRRRRRREERSRTLFSCKPEMICKLRFALSSSSWCHYEKTLQQHTREHTGGMQPLSKIIALHSY